MPRRIRVAVILTAMALPGCDGAASQRDAPAPPPHGTLRVSAGPVAAPYASSNRLVGLAGAEDEHRLGGEVNTSPFGVLAPGAVPDASGSALVYSSFDRDGPVLRLRDVRGGEEEILDHNAFSAGWRSDGALAYFKADEAAGDDPAERDGHVLVRADVTSAAKRWSRVPGRFVVAAWAGDRLLAYRREAGPWPDLVVFDGPGRMRVLAEGSGLIAIGPDGQRALVTARPDREASVHLLDIADGTRLAAFTFPDAPGRPDARAIGFVAPLGSWVDDVAVAAVTEGIASFRVGSRSVELQQLLRLDPESFPVGATEPQLDGTGRRVAAVVELAPRPQAALPESVVISCSRVSLRCRSTTPLPYVPAPRLVYNPSRP